MESALLSADSEKPVRVYKQGRDKNNFVTKDARGNNIIPFWLAVILFKNVG